MKAFRAAEILDPEPAVRRKPFVNMDAAFLFDLAAEMDADEEPDETTVRLRGIADRLERLDEQLRNLTKLGPFEAGIVEGKRRYLMRSNLPLQTSELTPDLRKVVLASNVPVKRVPSGKQHAAPKPNALSVAGIKLDFSVLRK